MPASLTIATGDNKNKVFIQSAKTIVGRGAQSDVQIEDESINGANFAIIRTQSGYALKSLSADGGTAINGKAVKQALLKPAGATAPMKPPTGAVRRPTTAIQRPTQAVRPTGQTSKMTPKPATARTTALNRKTSAIQKPATGRATASLKKPTGRIEKPTTGRARTRRSAADTRRGKHLNKFTKGPRRSALPVIILVAVVLGVVAGLGGFFGGGGDDENNEKKSLDAAQALMAEAFVAESDYGNLDEAARLLDQAIQRAGEAGEAGAQKKAEAETQKKALEGKIVQIQRANAEFEEIKKAYVKGLPPDLTEGEEFHRKLDDLRTKYKAFEKICKWYAESAGMLESVADHNNKLKAAAASLGWKTFKTDPVDALVAAGKYNEAYNRIQSRLEKFTGTDRLDAESYLQNQFQQAAAEGWLKLKTAALKHRPNGFDEAKKLIQDREVDFENTNELPKLTAAILKLDAKDWNLD